MTLHFAIDDTPFLLKVLEVTPKIILAHLSKYKGNEGWWISKVLDNLHDVLGYYPNNLHDVLGYYPDNLHDMCWVIDQIGDALQQRAHIASLGDL